MAIEELYRSLKLSPESAATHLRLSHAWHDAGDVNKALDHAEAAVKLSPTQERQTWLVELYIEAQLFEFALPLVEWLTSESPADYNANLAALLFYAAVGNIEKSKSHLAKAEAATHKPDEVVRLLAEKFRLGLYTNDLKLAQDAFSSLDLRDAINSEIIASYVIHANAEIGSDLWCRLEKTLESDGTENGRLALQLARGTLFDKAQQFDDAFKNWTAARSAQEPQRFSVKQERERLARRCQFFSSNLFKSLSNAGANDTPIFIMGMPRSGTTLLEQILGRHSLVGCVGELSRFNNLENAFLHQYDMPSSTLFNDATKGVLDAHAAETRKVFDLIAGSNKRAVEKTPHNFEAAGYLALVFPKAKFLHLQRHPADCFISSYQNRMSSWHDYIYNQTTYAEAYLIQEQYRALWQNVLPDRVMTVRYETLVEDPAATIRKVAGFLDLTWEEGMLKHSKPKSIRTLSRQQVQQPIYTGSRYRYRNYEKHLGELFSVLALHGFDYERANNSPGSES